MGGYNYISSQQFPPPVYPYSIGFTLSWTCVQHCIGVQYSLGVYQYYIERVIKGGLLSVGRPCCIVRPGYGVSGRDSIAALHGVKLPYSLLSLILFPLYGFISIEL